jgi:two-component system response regulator QseB
MERPLPERPLPERPLPDRTVLLVEDDAQLAAMLAELLRGEGFAVDVAEDGHRGLHLGLTRSYDVIVLDRGLPAVEGLDLLGRLRSRGVTAPVLVLSAQALPRDRVEGLDAGAEDYLGKPFDIDELLARVRALVRRQRSTARQLAVPGGMLEIEQRTVQRDDGSSTLLSGRETALLGALARRPRQVFSRDELVAEAFPAAEELSVVDTYVHYLRKKLGRDVVETVHGLGYRLGRS